jgi:hypothetical protein
VPQQFTAVQNAELLCSFYRNGKVEGAMSGFLLPATTTRTQNFLGKSLYAGCTPFSGRLSEVALYDRSSSSADIAMIEATLRTRWRCCNEP